MRFEGTTEPVIYGGLARNFYTQLLNGEHNFTSDDIRIALLGATSVARAEVHENFSDIENEYEGAGYTAGGLAMVPSIFRDLGRTHLAFQGVEWAAQLLNVRGAVIYNATTGKNILISSLTAGLNSNQPTFKLQFGGNSNVLFPESGLIIL